MKTRKFINRKFNTDIAKEIGLSSGIKRIDVIYRVDEKGKVNITSISAPHPKLKEEVIRVFNELPIMKPMRKNNKPMGVNIIFSINFRVE